MPSPQLLFPLASLCVLSSAPFGGETLSCRADMAVLCEAGACSDRPDENPNAELHLEKQGGAGEICTVTSCRPVRWSANGQDIEIRDGTDIYALRLPAPGSFLLARSDGVGWRGRCAADAG